MWVHMAKKHRAAHSSRLHSFVLKQFVSKTHLVSWLMLLNSLHIAVRHGARAGDGGASARWVLRAGRPGRACAGESTGHRGCQGFSSPQKPSQRLLESCTSWPGVIWSCLEPCSCHCPCRGCAWSGYENGVVLPGIWSSPHSPVTACQGLSWVAAASETC